MEAPRELSRPDRRATRRLARGLGLGALIASLLGALGVPAEAASGPGVLVEGPGAAATLVASGQLSGQPQVSAEYTLRSNPGEAGQRITRSGKTVAAVIALAGIDGGSVGYLTVRRADGTTAYLSGSDFREPSPFPDGPALISDDAGSTRFFLPVTADPGDVNAGENIATAGGEALTIGLREGEILTVRGAASPASVQSGQAVQFTATASGAEPGERIAGYRWSFGDGGTAEGQTVTHSYTGSGTFQARVTATGSAESGGESGPVDVVVGNPPAAPHAGSAPTLKQPKEKREPHGASGKEHGGNGGQATGGEPGEGSESGPSGPEGLGGGQPSTAAPAPGEAPPIPEEAPLPPAADQSETAAPVERPDRRPPAAAPGETVTGRLVAANLGPLSAAELAAAAGSTPGGGSASAPSSPATSGFAAPLELLAVAALLGGGALFEWRAPRRRAR